MKYRDSANSSVQKKKILLAATSGGHLSQAWALFGGLPDCEYRIFSEKTSRAGRFPCPFYQYRRVVSPFWTLVLAFFPVFFVILKERPDWVVSTGAECGTAAILAAKLLFRKTMFIETASRYRTKTMSAKICYPLVDEFFVQHEESLAIYGAKAKYMGGVL